MVGQKSLKSMENSPDFFSKDNVVAVVGASSDTAKWGRRVYDKLKAMGFIVYPVNPNEERIGGDRCYPGIKSLPRKPHLVITVTKPEITEKVVQDCIREEIPMLWMQPGSESAKAKATCRKAGLSHRAHECYVIDGLKVDW
jgi:predicted CoA-binding protein